ncbi:hypothetical protein Gohar_008430 [Gossypium harknessii]|uniref:Uncharacterized protein n=1 Tax=Gossypium harknessii TaxID=34285 RepID=A0A7J9GJP3_9ROSI|nr:hypothetical protein [Gossypium harknessii]
MQPLMRMYDNRQWELWPGTVKEMPFYQLQRFTTK